MLPLAAFALIHVAAPTAKERLAKMAIDFGIEIEVVSKSVTYSRPGYKVRAEAVSNLLLGKYVDLFETNWRRYPRTIFIRTKLGKIVIGAKVKVQDQPRAALPEFNLGWFWLDADTGVRVPEYGRQVLHHDFYHMIDEWDSPDKRTDKVWEALNAPTVKYGKGGWYAQKGNTGALRTDLPGFLSEYSISAVEEDKAEIFSHLIVSPKFVADRIKADKVLAAKVKMLKKNLVAFEPALDENWFLR